MKLPAANIVLGLVSLPFHRWVWQYTSVWDLMPVIFYIGLRSGWKLGDILEGK